SLGRITPVALRFGDTDDLTYSLPPSPDGGSGSGPDGRGRRPAAAPPFKPSGSFTLKSLGQAWAEERSPTGHEENLTRVKRRSVSFCVNAFHLSWSYGGSGMTASLRGSWSSIWVKPL